MITIIYMNPSIYKQSGLVEIMTQQCSFTPRIVHLKTDGFLGLPLGKQLMKWRWYNDGACDTIRLKSGIFRQLKSKGGEA